MRASCDFFVFAVVAIAERDFVQKLAQIGLLRPLLIAAERIDQFLDRRPARLLLVARLVLILPGQFFLVADPMDQIRHDRQQRLAVEPLLELRRSACEILRIASLAAGGKLQLPAGNAAESISHSGRRSRTACSINAVTLAWPMPRGGWLMIRNSAISSAGVASNFKYATISRTSLRS